MDWDSEYQQKGDIWGNEPSQLAMIATKYLREKQINLQVYSLLDIGCGYGRDCFYLSEQLKCNIVGVEKSKTAIDIAASSNLTTQGKPDFICSDFLDMNEDRKFEILCASNLYPTLKPQERSAFRKKAGKLLKPGGYLFLNALSVNDKEEFGKGNAVEGEHNSFIKEKYLHFFNETELSHDFAAFDIEELYELEYEEYLKEGNNHYHTTWVLILRGRTYFT